MDTGMRVTTIVFLMMMNVIILRIVFNLDGRLV